MTDRITIKTRDGKIFTDVAASVQRGKIFTERTDIPICPGDQVSHRTQAGIEEIFIVEDPGFHSGLDEIPSTYQMCVRLADDEAINVSKGFYAKALRLLKEIYERTIGKDEPVMIWEIHNAIELSEEEANAAWRYLRDKGLIETFSVQNSARINARGIDTIETARSRPNEPAKDFSSVTFNNITIQQMTNSAIQQGGAHATMTQTVNYNLNNCEDLRRLVGVFEYHIEDLGLDASLKRKAMAQVSTIKAQLDDEPDPVIIKQAGRTLRNVTEGAIAGLIATATQTTVWAWVKSFMAAFQ